MTEHRKIVVPEPSDRPKKSLLERASGAFGFDPFKGTPIKSGLPEPVAKRGKAAKRPIAAGEASPTNAPASVKAEIVGHAAHFGDEVVPAPSLTAPAAPKVTFAGPKVQIDREILRANGMIVPNSPAGTLREEFRIVKREILATANEEGTALSRRILLSSPHPNDGKTFCTVNLALAMASEQGIEVVLVDADFAKPSVLSTLGLKKHPGLMDCLINAEINPEDLVLETDIEGLFVLPAGDRTVSDPEYLSSARAAEVLERLTRGAANRYLIFDTPPALAASPAAELAKQVGQAILVAKADKTGRNSLEDAYQLLSGCKDVKLLLNAVQYSPSGRNFGSYYGYEE